MYWRPVNAQSSIRIHSALQIFERGGEGVQTKNEPFRLNLSMHVLVGPNEEPEYSQKIV